MHTPSRPATLRRLIGTVVILMCGCRDSRPAAIVVDVDPFLLNGPGPVGLPAHVVTASGGTLVDARLSASSDAASVATAENGGLRCFREGDAHLTLAMGSLTASLLVQCRPVMSFAPFPSVELEAHGAPGSIPVVAYAANLRPVTELRFSARSQDTTVAIVRDGLVVPRKLGRTRLELDFGGIQTLGGVTVVIPEQLDTVALAAGEYRSWPLPAGRFRISAHSPDGRETGTGVTLLPNGANCARDRQQKETIHCVVADSAEVVALAPSRLNMILRIVRMPE